MCIVVEETNIEAILAIMNTTSLVVKIEAEKNIQAHMSFEPHDLCDTNVWVQILYRPEFFLGLYSRLVK